MVDHIVFVYGKDHKKQFYVHVGVFTYSNNHRFHFRVYRWDDAMATAITLNPKKVSIVKSVV